ncbi:MAG: PRC-barrel domain containing protein [Puniceicoccaceae bacterium]|nr:MAG: PRC-barrel domain containing protein [Puniceicoccaceae bacterium]
MKTKSIPYRVATFSTGLFTIAALCAAPMLMAGEHEYEQKDTSTWEDKTRELLDSKKYAAHEDIKGLPVYGSDEERLGKFEAVVFHPETGAISHFVLSTGGMFGVGATRKQLPFDQIQLTEDRERFTINLTAEELEWMPEFHREAAMGTPRPDVAEQRATRVEPMTRAGRPEDADAHQRTREATGETPTTAEERDGQPVADVAGEMPAEQRPMDAGSLIGMTLLDTDGESVGSVTNLLVDIENAKLRYAVVGIGGFLGLAETEVAVPYDQLKLDREAEEVRIPQAASAIAEADEGFRDWLSGLFED